MDTLIKITLSIFFILNINLSYGRASDKIFVTFMFSSVKQRTVFENQVKQFEKENASIKVYQKIYEQEEYKRLIENWLHSDTYKSDVFFWFAGEKLRRFVSRGWVEPIDKLWMKKGWDNEFNKSSKAVVSINNKIYGLPISYYHWGFYYRKSIFQKYKIDQPKDWDSFLKMGEVLKANNIPPIILGTKYKWTVAGWFDYLNLRINGIEFHQLLMEGTIPYTDKRVKAVFQKWKELLNRDFFLNIHSKLDWRTSVQYLTDRNKAGVILSGNFLIPQIPKNKRDDIGFFRFPQINSHMPYYEEAPMDIMFIPHNAKNKEGALKFLAYIGRSDNQYMINSQMGMISPNQKAKESKDRFIQAGAKILEEAKGVTQYFDRDTPPELFNPGMDAMKEFMNNPEAIDQILEKLEKVRKEVMIGQRTKF